MSREVVPSLYCYNYLISFVMLDYQRKPLMRIDVKQLEIWEWSDHTRGNWRSVRLLLTDEAWTEIAPILAAIKSRAGSPPAFDCMFIEAASIAPARGCPGATCYPIWGLGCGFTTACAAGKHTVSGARSGTLPDGGLP
jgi:hypothetical protein